MLRRIFALCGIVLLAAACSSNEENEPTTAPLAVITEAAESPTPTATLNTTATAAPTTAATPQATLNNATLANCTPRTDWVMTYTVKAGETLTTLADWADTTVAELA